MKKLLISIIKFYRKYLSPLKRSSTCIYIPTCSQYAVEALERFGALKGTWLTIKRLCRCHPWGGYGFDPVPEKEETPKKQA